MPQCLHQKPWEPHPDLFNPTPMERQSFTGKSHPVTSLSWATHHGNCDLTMLCKQPSLFFIATSRVQKHEPLAGSPGVGADAL